MTATPRRELSELIVADSMVWDNIQEWARLGVNTILPITRDYGQSQLLDLQMTTLSSFGALTLHCGGILADHGWLKLFGGGTDDMPSLDSFISGIEESRGAGLCGIDVLGGVFAVNWGAFPGKHHRLWYWALDLLDWQRCGDLNRAPTPMSSIVDHWTNIGTPDPYPMVWPLDDHQPS